MFHEYLDTELTRSSRFKRPLSLILIDIDYFKKVNDKYGHQAGDIVLQRLSDRISRESRGVDHVCRYGGEEIAIILPETDAAGAQQAANRIKLAATTLPFDIGNDKTVYVTISLGIATYPIHGESANLLLAAADSAMYKAKENGRDQICIYTPEK
jgi:diguanylate cyclase (GGDEF)-like protein